MNYNLLELCGKGYVIDNYISFLHKEAEEKSYKCYVTDVLKVIAKNTASKEGDLVIENKWRELIEPPKKKTDEENTKEEKTENEVIEDLRTKLAKCCRK